MRIEENRPQRMPGPVGRLLITLFIILAMTEGSMVALTVQLAIMLHQWAFIPLALVAMAVTAWCLLFAAAIRYGQKS